MYKNILKKEKTPINLFKNKMFISLQKVILKENNYRIRLQSLKLTILDLLEGDYSHNWRNLSVILRLTIVIMKLVKCLKQVV